MRLQPFRSAIAAGVQLVMVSNAKYPNLDPSDMPAVFSRTTVRDLLRGALGFHGAVVSNTLDAPTPASATHASGKAIAAGVDLLLYTSAAAARITALKDWLGSSC